MVIKKRELKIALLGPYPPPYGGVSIHIQRLSNLLFENDIDCTIYDITQFIRKEEKIDNSLIKKWFKIIFFSRGIIHIHNSGLNLLKIFILSSILKIRGNKILITYHSLRENIENFSWFKKKVLRLSFNSISYFIVVNSKIKEKLVNIGVKNEKIIVIPGFLPPTELKQDMETIPIEIWDFIKNHQPIISANAFRIEFYNNQDLYGIDMCIDLCSNLKKKYPQIGFVFCLPSIGDYDYFSEMKNKIVQNSIEKNFIFITQPYQFYPILKASDLFVRPTNTDGDAVSLRESIYFKIPSVVSDVISRPNGTNVFHNRDIADFTLKAENILKNYKYHKKNLENFEIENNFNKIMSVYKKIHN